MIMIIATTTFRFGSFLILENEQKFQLFVRRVDGNLKLLVQLQVQREIAGAQAHRIHGEER